MSVYYTIIILCINCIPIRRRRHLVPDRRRVLRVKRALSEPAAYERGTSGDEGKRKGRTEIEWNEKTKKKNKRPQSSPKTPRPIAANAYIRYNVGTYSSLPAGRILTVHIRPTLNILYVDRWWAYNISYNVPGAIHECMKTMLRIIILLCI